MPPQPASPLPSPTAKAFQIAGGIIFLALWIAFHLLWISLAGMANLMANDSGSATTNQQMTLIFGMLAGQIIACLAGVPAALAFVWRGKRRLLLALFGILFVIGAACQAWVFHDFFSHLPG